MVRKFQIGLANLIRISKVGIECLCTEQTKLTFKDNEICERYFYLKGFLTFLLRFLQTHVVCELFVQRSNGVCTESHNDKYDLNSWKPDLSLCWKSCYFVQNPHGSSGPVVHDRPLRVALAHELGSIKAD